MRDALVGVSCVNSVLPRGSPGVRSRELGACLELGVLVRGLEEVAGGEEGTMERP